MELEMIPRLLTKTIEDRFFHKKAILLFGARQVGKTTLVKSLLKQYEQQSLILNADEPDVRKLLTEPTSTFMKTLFSAKRIVLIDEAQRIPAIGIILKLIVDEIPQVQVIATGSSSFELGHQVIEPLTGRKYVYTLYSIAFQEIAQHIGMLEEARLLQYRLVYGSYPEIISKPGEEKELLHLLTDSYLYKDLYKLQTIMKPSVLERIVETLALQLGSEVSFNELSQLVGVDRTTVEKYIELLEQSFVVFKIPSFSKNARNEIKKGKKIYFYDNGIRNTIINSLWKIENRQDIGGLWENYLITERKKLLAYHRLHRKQFFWRTAQRQEIDYIEEGEKCIRAYEFKWNQNARMKIPKTFSIAYPHVPIKLITPSNYQYFLTDPEF
jgi:uncharacterized protein